MKNLYSNEKIIFSSGEVNLSFTNPYAEILSFFIKELKKITSKYDRKNLKVIDIGCGAGSMTKAIKIFFPFLEIYGCDISRKAIKIAREKPGGVYFSVVDGTNIPFKNKEFDIVIVQSVIDHTNNPQKILEEIKRILKKDGKLLISGPLEAEPTTIHGFLTHFEKFRNHRKRRCGHNFAFSKKSFLGLIKKNGFKIESTVSIWFLFAQLVDILYYSTLELFGKKPEQTINRYIIDKNTFFSKVLKYLRKIFVIFFRLENFIIKPFNIGFYIFVKAKKE